MRIESPVGFSTPAGEPAEEKAAGDSAGGLFMNILDCLQVLSPAPPSGKSAEGSQVLDVAQDTGGPGGSTTPEAWLVSPNPDTTPLRQVFDSAAHLMYPTSSGSVAAVITPAAVFFQQQTEMPEDSLAPQDATAGEGDAARPGEGKTDHNSAATTANLPDASFNPEIICPGNEAAKPQAIAPVPEPQVMAVADTNAAPPPTAGTGLPSTGGFFNGVAISPALSSFAVRPASPGHVFAGLDFNGNMPATAATSRASRRGGNAPAVHLSQGGGATQAKAAAAETTVLSEGPGTWMPVTRALDAVGQEGGADVQTHLSEAQPLISRPTDRMPEGYAGKQADRPETGNSAQGQSPVPAAKSNDHQPGQADPALRPSGSAKPGPAADPAAQALEPEKIVSGREKLRTVAGRSGQDDSTIASTPGMIRDTQTLHQASPAVKEVKSPGFVFEVAERISSVVAGARGEITIQLKPDQFGRLNIVAESGAGGIMARITTESASLKQYLESNLPVLQQALQEQGLKVERIDVLVQEGPLQHHSPSQWQQNFGHGTGGHESGGNMRHGMPTLAQPAEISSDIMLDAVTLGALYPHSTFHTVA